MRHPWGVQWWRVRATANWVNLSTPLGLLVARMGRAQVDALEGGLHLATLSTLTPARAGAFTIGSVVITRHDRQWVDQRPRLLLHERRHSCQYAVCGGLPFLPLYAAAAAWSWWRTADLAAHNPFERTAGLADGGYAPRPLVPRLVVRGRTAKAGRALSRWAAERPHLRFSGKARALR